MKQQKKTIEKNFHTHKILIEGKNISAYVESFSNFIRKEH
jgi:hypothetical protein